MKIIDEFKAFAIKGNMIDLAVGVIVGSAFGAIVTSLTNDIIMPPIGWMIGGIDFTSLKIAMPQEIIGDNSQIVYIYYGKFIQTIINFLIISSSIFMVVRFMSKLQNKADAKAEPPAPSKQEQLLAEIRDLLKNQSK